MRSTSHIPSNDHRLDRHLGVPGATSPGDAMNGNETEKQTVAGKIARDEQNRVPGLGCRRRNRRGTERIRADPAAGKGALRPLETLAETGPVVEPSPRSTQEIAKGPKASPAHRAGPAVTGDSGASPATWPRRTEGTRPPDQGNGRGLSDSPRNPNHYGEIPIRPDNRTFDALHDRLVCIARSHVIPEDFPVHYRRATASSRLGVVARSESDLLLCDFSHGGPHIWPDQTVVNDDYVHGAVPDPTRDVDIE